VTLARLDGIPTLAHGNENLFVLFEIISHGIGQFVMIICEINLSTD